MSAPSGDHWDICLSTLRETDRDRYLACLLSPADKRGALSALYAFHAEIARIRDVIHQPLAGEIRLQWWRDLLQGTAAGEGSANPVASALLETIDTYRLPREVLVAMTEARIFDLYDDPMPDRTALEGYAGETASALIQLAGLILDAPAAMRGAEIAGHAGVAQAIAGALLLLPMHTRRGQVYIPQDILSATGLDRETLLAGTARDNIGAAVEAMAALGLDHLARARAAGRIDAGVVAAFLPVALAEGVLKTASRRGAAVMDEPLQPAQWRRQLSMMRLLATRRL